MKMGSDCMILLGKTGSGGRTGGFAIMSGHQSSVTAQAVCRSCSGCFQLGKTLNYTVISVLMETRLHLGLFQIQLGKHWQG